MDDIIIEVDYDMQDYLDAQHEAQSLLHQANCEDLYGDSDPWTVGMDEYYKDCM